MARSKSTATAEVIELGGQVPTSGADETILYSEPYVAQVEITGTAPYIYHAWNVEAVEAKANAAKGSKAKKTDDIESYIYRNDQGFLCIPGEQLRMAIVNAGRYLQDPRSPRKSAMDLLKAAIVVLTHYASTGAKTWDYLDKRRVIVQRSAITRTRPALKEGWKVKFEIEVLLPEYVGEQLLNEIIQKAGRFCGLGDHRPSYGRFNITSFVVR